MTVNAIIAVHLISALLSLASAYSVFFPMNVCKATLIEHEVKGTLADCTMPTTINSFNNVHYVHSHVTKPAKLGEIEVDWFLAMDGTPAINVTIRATSQNSAQDYKIELLATPSIAPIFCTRILTEKPDPDNTPQKQTFGIEIRCNDKALKRDDMETSEIFVPVHVKGAEPVLQKFTLPTCKDPVMAESNVCKEQKKKHIEITLKQDENTTIVILNTKSAYPEARPDSKVYVMIQEKNEHDVWQVAQPPVELFWPERTTRFSNLTIGKTYRVQVWRPTEYVRYYDLITMKEDQKEDVPNKRFLSRIQKRKARRAARRARRERANA